MIAFRQIAHWRVLRPTHSMTLLLALVVSLPAVSAFAAAPSDRSKLWETCRNNDGEAGLTACMAIINTRGIPARERATAYYNRCYRYILGHDYRNALANCDKSLEDNPSFVDAWLNRSTIRSGLGQFDLAIKDATQALAMANNNSDRAGALRNRAAAFVRRGNIAESQADLDHAASCNLAMSTISSTGPTSCCNSAVPMRRSGRLRGLAPPNHRQFFAAEDVRRHWPAAR